MRIRLTLEDEIVAEVDRQVGAGERSRFIAEAVRNALSDRHKWDEMEAALGSIPDEGHEWDNDPGAWVHNQRHSDLRR